LTSATKVGRLSSSESALPSWSWGSSFTALVCLWPTPSSSEFRPYDGAQAYWPVATVFVNMISYLLHNVGSMPTCLNFLAPRISYNKGTMKKKMHKKWCKSTQSNNLLQL
jgi:hypothetical protein